MTHWEYLPTALSGLLRLDFLNKRTKVRLRRISRYLPKFTDVMFGQLLIILGAMSLTGGSVGIQTSSDAAPIWIPLPHFEKTFVAWILISLGIDSCLSGGRLIPLVMNKAIYPIVAKILEPFLKPLMNSIKERRERKESLHGGEEVNKEAH